MSANKVVAVLNHILCHSHPPTKGGISPGSEPCGSPPLYAITNTTIRVVVFHRRSELLPRILHLPCLFTRSDLSQAQQGLLSPLILQSPFPLLQFRKIVDRDSGNLVNPFMQITNYMTRHLASATFYIVIRKGGQETYKFTLFTCPWLTLVPQ